MVVYQHDLLFKCIDETTTTSLLEPVVVIFSWFHKTFLTVFPCSMTMCLITKIC